MRSPLKLHFENNFTGKVYFSELKEMNSIIGQLAFSLYILFVIIVFINLFISIMIVAFREVTEKNRQLENRCALRVEWLGLHRTGDSQVPRHQRPSYCVRRERTIRAVTVYVLLNFVFIQFIVAYDSTVP